MANNPQKESPFFRNGWGGKLPKIIIVSVCFHLLIVFSVIFLNKINFEREPEAVKIFELVQVQQPKRVAPPKARPKSDNPKHEPLKEIKKEVPKPKPELKPELPPEPKIAEEKPEPEPAPEPEPPAEESMDLPEDIDLPEEIAEE